MKLSAIVPIRNDERTIIATLEALRLGAPGAEIVAVDGACTDSSAELARTRCNVMIRTTGSRARLMNSGAAASSGDVIAFVPPGSIVPITWQAAIEEALIDPAVLGGSFHLEFDYRSPSLRIIEQFANLRCCLTGVASLAQTLFIRRSAFGQLGGFADLAVCEEIQMVKRLKRLGKVVLIPNQVIVPAARWRQDGIPETALRLILIRLLFMAGAEQALLLQLEETGLPWRLAGQGLGDR